MFPPEWTQLWKRHANDLPHWSKACKNAFVRLASSAMAERVFFLFYRTVLLILKLRSSLISTVLPVMYSLTNIDTAIIISLLIGGGPAR